MVGRDFVWKTNDRKIIYCLYFVGFMDLLSVSVILPSITRHARNLGASPAVVGIIASIYGGIQLFSSPVMGKVSDVAGRRRTLLLSLCGTSVGYLLLGSSDSLLFMALFRIPSGILKHSQSIAKTYLADVTSPLERPQVLGTFNAASSLGFVVGPIIGGHVSMLDNGFSKVATLAAVGMFLNCIFVFVFVEDEHHLRVTTRETVNLENTSVNGTSSAGLRTKKILKNQQDDSNTLSVRERSAQSADGVTHRERKGSEDSSTENNIQGVYTTDQLQSKDEAKTWLSKRLTLLQVPSVSSVVDLLLIRFIMGLSMMIFRGNFSTVLEFRYQTTPKTIGYIISFNGLVGGFSGILVGKLSKFYRNDAKMLLHFSVLLTASILCITFSPDIWMIPLFITPLAISSAVSRVCITNITFKRGKEDEKGVLLGLGNSLLSFGRMLSPIVGGIALEYSIYGSGLLSVVTAMAGISVMLISPQDKDVKKENIKKNE